MTLATKLILIAALVLSIFIPFGYYLLGEKNKGRYKCALAVNAFFFWNIPCSRDHALWKCTGTCTGR